MDSALRPRVAWPRVLPVALVVATVIFLDQVTKFAVRAHLLQGESFPEDWPVRFTRVVNTGSAFGLFGGQTVFLIVASFVAIGIMLLFYRQVAAGKSLVKYILGLQLGGAVSNLADRIRDGHVTDFIELPRWPVFNVADSCITIGIVLLVLVAVLNERRPRPSGH